MSHRRVKKANAVGTLVRPTIKLWSSWLNYSVNTLYRNPITMKQ
jgi:hypothetical protein